jgi:hypothetical protein
MKFAAQHYSRTRGVDTLVTGRQLLLLMILLGERSAPHAVTRSKAIRVAN